MMNSLRQIKFGILYDRVIGKGFSGLLSIRNASTISKYCFDSVKNSDYENFLALLLIKDENLRRHAFTIRALNIELARVHDVTTENKIAEMRMKFWEDAVDRIYGDSETKSIPEHPVVKQLKKV